LLLAKEDKETAFYNATLGYKHKDIRENIMWANENMTKEELNKLLLAENNDRRTAWHLALRWGKPRLLDKLWEWANELPNTS
jgi:hypothetical protein